MAHLAQVLEILKKHQLFVKLQKCSFAQKEVNYLGHVIYSKRVSMDKDKVQSVLQWPTPENMKAVRSFLGLVGYYHKLTY